MAADGTIRIDTKLDSSGLSSGLNMLGSMAKTGAKTMTAAVGAVSTAMGGVATYAVKVGTNFEAGMSEVAAISNATVAELEKLTEKAKEMGAKTKFSATESAEAFKYMAMAGWETADMLDGIDGVMNLAAASGEDLASVSDIVTDALTAFGLQAKDSAHFADVLAQASSRSNTNVGLMGYTFKYVAPIAGALGYSIEDMAVAIGLMANAGIKGEQAGTQLRSVLSRMSKPTSETQAAMDKLGLSLTDSEGDMKSFAEVMQDMRTGFSQLTDAEKTTYAAMLGGQEAISGLLAIVGASDEDFDKLTAAIAASDGTAQKMADTMNDNVQGAFTIMKSAAEGFGITVYESMQMPLKELCQEGTVYLEQLTEAFQKGGLSGAVEAAGGMFAEIAAKAAKAAPEMISAAVDFIKAFVKGISDNRAQLLTAARDIVYALVDGLVSLLPREVQKPVKETVSILKKSFESGGLKEAISTVGTILKNLGKTVTSIAKVVLPPLAKAIDLVGKNTKILIPLVAGVAAAFKAYSIVKQATGYMTALNAAVVTSKIAQGEEAVATAVSTGALTLKQVAVGVLTGQIGLATAAQWLWNTAMSANPIGLVVVAIAGLIAGIAALCACYGDVETAEDRLKASNEKLAESYDNVFTAMDEFIAGVEDAREAAKSSLDEILVDNARKEAIEKEMQSVQDSIWDVCNAAMQERRTLTEAEIARIDDLMTKMRDLANEEYEIQKSLQEASLQISQGALESFSGTSEELDKLVKERSASAQEAADQALQAESDAYQKEVAALQAKHKAAGTINSTAYTEEFEALQNNHKQREAEIKRNAGAELHFISEKHAELDDELSRTLSVQRKYAAEQSELDQEISVKKAELLEKNKDFYAGMSEAMKEEALEQNIEWQSAMEEYQNETARINNNLAVLYSDRNSELLGAWLAEIQMAKDYGAELTETDKQNLAAFLRNYDTLPDEMKEKADAVMQAFSLTFRNGELYYTTGAQAGRKFIEGYNAQDVNGNMRKNGENAGASLAQGLRDKLYLVSNAAGEVASAIDKNTKKTLEIRSPSHKQRGNGQDATEGLALGVADKKADVERASEEIADVPLRLSKRLMDRMRSVAASMTERFTAPIQIRTEQEVSMLSSASEPETQTGGTAGGKPTQVVTHLHINGREAAIAITPYIEEEMAFE